MNRLRRISITWRITIGSVLIGAVLLIAAGLPFHRQVRQAQIDSDKKLLHSASTPYIAQIRDHPADLERLVSTPQGQRRMTSFRRSP